MSEEAPNRTGEPSVQDRNLLIQLHTTEYMALTTRATYLIAIMAAVWTLAVSAEAVTIQALLGKRNRASACCRGVGAVTVGAVPSRLVCRRKPETNSKEDYWRRLSFLGIREV